MALYLCEFYNEILNFRKNNDKNKNKKITVDPIQPKVYPISIGMMLPATQLFPNCTVPLAFISISFQTCQRKMGPNTSSSSNLRDLKKTLTIVEIMTLPPINIPLVFFNIGCFSSLVNTAKTPCFLHS